MSKDERIVVITGGQGIGYAEEYTLKMLSWPQNSPRSVEYLSEGVSLDLDNH